MDSGLPCGCENPYKMAHPTLKGMTGASLDRLVCYDRTRQCSTVMEKTTESILRRGRASCSGPSLIYAVALLLVCVSLSLTSYGETLSNVNSDAYRKDVGTFPARRSYGANGERPSKLTISAFSSADAVSRTDSSQDSQPGVIDPVSGQGVGVSSDKFARLRRQDTTPAAKHRGGLELPDSFRGKGASQSLTAGGLAVSSQSVLAPQEISFFGTMGVVKTRKKKHRNKDVTEDELRYAPTTAEEFRAGWRREEQVNEVPFCKDLGFGGFHPDDSTDNFCWSRCGRGCESWMFLSQDSKSSWTLVADAKRVKPCLTPANKSHRNILCKAVKKPTTVDYVEAVRHEMDIVAPEQVPPMAIGFQGPDPRMVLQPSPAVGPQMPYYPQAAMEGAGMVYGGPAAMPGDMRAGSDGLDRSTLYALPLGAASLVITVSLMLFG